MNKAELQAKYPHHQVKNDPAPGCTVCQGTGEFINAKREQHLCICTCLGGDDPKIRVDMAKWFQESVHNMVEELRANKRRVV